VCAFEGGTTTPGGVTTDHAGASYGAGIGARPLGAR
jgi:hypothetical protein